MLLLLEIISDTYKLAGKHCCIEGFIRSPGFIMLCNTEQGWVTAASEVLTM